MNATPVWRTEPYAAKSALMTHAEIDTFSTLAAEGTNYPAPPMWALVTLGNGQILPSE